MSMVLDENVIGIWFVNLSSMSDWLGTISLDDNGDYELIYRFRYYVDDKAHDSADRKNWTKAIIAKRFGGVTKVIDHMRSVVQQLAKLAGDVSFHEILMTDEGLDDFMERFQELPFVHVAEPERIH